MVLDEESAKCLTINTHLGPYQYIRLPFGVASAPAMFQRAMDMILQGLDGVIVYIDDILVTGSTNKEHLERLEEVLKRLKEYGLRVKKHYCQPLVEYLGHQVDTHGLHTLSSKVAATVQAPGWICSDPTTLLRWERSKQHRKKTTILMHGYVSTKLEIML